MKVELADNFQAAQWMHGKTTVRPSPHILELYLLNQYLRQIDAMAKGGVKEVRILSSGSECVACAELSGKKFKMAEVPRLPPAGCQCEPHCKCVPISCMEVASYRNYVPASEKILSTSGD